MKKILVTGAAGFIGMHLALSLLGDGYEVTGYDNLNEYYDISLKLARLEKLRTLPLFEFVKGDLADGAAVRQLLSKGDFDCVVNLAAQAGVRYSLTHPETYISSNLTGFFNIIDAVKEFAVPHFVYASSSSVYGANTKLPFSEEDKTESPVSLYAATKKANELLAHSYSSMFGTATTGFRFFTVYGPYGRPDMALFIFVKNILDGVPLQVFNHGDMQRDFTYIDDIVAGIRALMERSASLTDEKLPYRVYNIGNSSPVQLMDFIGAIEDELGKKAVIEFMPLQPGDVKSTYADVCRLEKDTGFAPRTPLAQGVRQFVQWYRDYYNLR
ncbi:MAG: NAD-dependent epimerase/dehydratase family protein [Oscillospiraceae bacterium]|nr:NAD-dependent epimerase/dehydratase family protein [Oscillospiraceae bacterium]